MSYGEGSIYKKTDTKTGKQHWVVELQLGLNSKGKPRTTRRRARDYKHALKIRRELQNQIADGGLETRNDEKLMIFAKNWVRNHKALTLKPSTASDYEFRLTNYVFPYLGNKKIKEIDYETVNRWLNQLVADNYSANTINGARTIFSQLCKHAVRQGILKTNPVTLTDKLRKDKKSKSQVRDAWDLQEAQAALHLSMDSEYDLFINLGIRLGLRHGEILGLTWDAIDLENNQIEIKATLKDERRIDETGKGIVRLRMQTPKTQASCRVLKITPNLRDAITRHQMLQTVRKLNAQEKWQETGMVFTTSIGTAKSQSNNLKGYKKFLAENNLRYIRVHDMRHSYAELGLEAGAPLEAVSQSLGHADIGITKKLYAPNVRGLNTKAIETLDSFLDPTLTVPLDWTQGEESVTVQASAQILRVPESKQLDWAKLDNRKRAKH